MSNAMDVTGSTFDAEVKQSDKPVLVDFWAPWCGPCRAMGPVLDEVAAAKADTVKIVKINCDDEGELAGQFGISSIPCMILFKGGDEVDRFIGATDKDNLSAWLDSKC